MTKRSKSIILTLTLLLTLGVFLQSQFNLFSFGDKDFEATPYPLTAYNEAQAKSEPIFLEFYADW